MTDDLDRYFVSAVGALRPGSDLGEVSQGLALLDAQFISRHVDFAARYLQGRGHGFYTIGSAGHESNAALAAVLRPTDPALLHYRSGAFYARRAAQVSDVDPVWDMLAGVVASTEEPIAGGRHKVFGRKELAVIPQTSTIASHLPRAVGVAFAMERARKLTVAAPWPEDAVVVCSFGDASVNHSTAVGALNTARYVRYQGLPMPVLFVCEDNGFGISVRTPPGWIDETLRGRLPYFTADGADPVAATTAASEAADYVRSRRAPAVLHLRTVRFLAHAGSDAEISYRSSTEITQEYAHDPLLGTARMLVSAGALTAQDVLRRYEAVREEVARQAEHIVTRPKLDTAEAIMAPLAPWHPDFVRTAATKVAAPQQRQAGFGGTLPEHEGPLTVAQAINRGLAELLGARSNSLLFGEDIGRKGGVYGVTRGLQRRFGQARVFDSVLDEQSILGLALGAGLCGLLPIPEIQYLAYLHNAADQLRGEAATLPFFSAGQYRNPMIVRIAAYGYQKGFGGHFHNDNAVAALRDIPGLVVASPARPDDAATMLRSCAAAAETDGTISAFLEPIALYHTRDLHTEGDYGWLAPYPAPRDWETAHAPLGTGRTHGTGTDLTLISFGNGLRMSLQVARRLTKNGVHARVLDLRWLAPLPAADIVRESQATGRVLIADETRHTGGVGEAVLSTLVEAGYRGKMARVASKDSFIPLGPAANHVLLDDTSIEKAAHALLET